MGAVITYEDAQGTKSAQIIDDKILIFEGTIESPVITEKYFGMQGSMVNIECFRKRVFSCNEDMP